METSAQPVRGKVGGRPLKMDEAVAELEFERLAALDLAAVRRFNNWMKPVLKGYFRDEMRHAERFPTKQTIVVTHHDGGVFPVNGFSIGTAWHEQHDFKKPLYVLSHELFHRYSKVISKKFCEVGIVPADRKTMDAAMASGSSVLVMPGAARESFRTYGQRADIDLGGRTGFISQAIRWDVPITPVVCAGSHETVIVLAGGHSLARRLGVPKLVRSGDVLPILAGFPWGIWALPFLPQFPLPAKLTSEVLEPMYLPDVLGRKLRPRDAEDPTIVQAGFDAVLAAMRGTLRRLYSERRFPVIG